MRKPYEVVDHPLGGTVSFYRLNNGRVFSVLDDAFPYADDFEIHERSESISREVDGKPGIISGTETRAPDLEAVLEFLDAAEQ